MNITKFSISACRYCRYYQPEGRRGGKCQILSVPVASDWKACALASSPFETNYLQLENIFNLESSPQQTASSSSSERATVASSASSI